MNSELQREKARQTCIARNTTHGMSKTKSYISWQHMVLRCTDPDNSQYPNYGGRGIKVCARWKKFENFVIDMGERPENKTLDRINNNKGYCKSNCRWASKIEQMNNTRKNNLLTYNNKTLSVSQWERELNFKPGTVKSRLQYGWAPDKALSTPLKRQWWGHKV